MNPIQITCPNCNVANRVPEERIGDKPQCGKCKKPLFLGKPLDLHPGNVNAVLGKNYIPVLVDCWASWCGPCKSFAPVFEQAAGIFEPGFRFAKLDTEAAPSIAERWAIRSIPTLILFKQGKEIQRASGAMSLPQLQQWLRAANIN
ncbi:MAG: thioredoxin TrxC [Gammaproteobacteria bacterium]|nr:MAG: thioredoxin TrxC [Gammaproteobacteria bacterium]